MGVLSIVYYVLGVLLIMYVHACMYMNLTYDCSSNLPCCYTTTPTCRVRLRPIDASPSFRVFRYLKGLKTLLCTTI